MTGTKSQQIISELQENCQTLSKCVCHSDLKHESLTVEVTVLAKDAPRSSPWGSFSAPGRVLFEEKQIFRVVCSAHLTLTENM